ESVPAVRRALRRLAKQKSRFSLRLLVAGTLGRPAEKEEFEQMLEQPGAELIEHFGFVSGDQKNQLLREADLFCFPTYYENENQPVNLIEAMAFGVPILTTRWRSLPELFPANYAGLVDVRAPEQIANVMPALMTGDAG